MTGTTDQRARPGGDLAAAARDRGMEKLEGAKGQVAEGAERIASAVERTADELEGDGDAAISGFGRSVASLMRQLAGGLRERDVEQFADELGALARRNPAVFLAGSVALGFGVARFFKARSPHSGYQSRGWQDPTYPDDGGGFEARPSTFDSGSDFDSDESLDLSRNPTGVERTDESSALDTPTDLSNSGATQSSSANRTDSSFSGSTESGSSKGGKAP